MYPAFLKTASASFWASLNPFSTVVPPDMALESAVAMESIALKYSGKADNSK